MVSENYMDYGEWVLKCAHGTVSQKQSDRKTPSDAITDDLGPPMSISFMYRDGRQFGPVRIPAGAMPRYFRRVDRANGRIVSLEFWIGWKSADGFYWIAIDAETGEVRENAKP